MTKLTKKKLETILTRRLGLVAPEFRLEKASERLIGNVISVTFKGKRDHERQKMIWDALEAELGADSVLRVGMLLAYTPDEWNLDADEKPTPKAKKAG
jgi:acid stress-induced BolA-like protein IbaG/YrbA